MSTLRKQEIRSKKRKKNSVNYSEKIAHPLAGILFMAMRAPIGAARWTFEVARKSPRVSLIIAVIASIALAIALGVSELHKMESRQLPTNIFILSESDRLSERVNQVAWKTLQESRKAKLSRSEFMRNLSQTLKSVEELDDFDLRVDLARNLQISASAQTPAFIAEIDDSSRWIVSERLVIIGPAATTTGSSDLVLVKLPESKMTQKVRLGKNDSGRQFHLSNVNLPWIHRQIKAISLQKTYFEENNLQLESLVWRSSSGLTAMFSHKSNSVSGASSSTPLTAVLGESDIVNKVEKLKLLTKDFATKSTFPEHVDLSFSDRALVKMRLSESSTPVSF